MRECEKLKLKKHNLLGIHVKIERCSCVAGCLIVGRKITLILCRSFYWKPDLVFSKTQKKNTKTPCKNFYLKSDLVVQKHSPLQQANIKTFWVEWEKQFKKLFHYLSWVRGLCTAKRAQNSRNMRLRIAARHLYVFCYYKNLLCATRPGVFHYLTGSARLQVLWLLSPRKKGANSRDACIHGANLYSGGASRTNFFGISVEASKQLAECKCSSKSRW